MKCPNCETEVFDIYTTEQRIKELYKANLNLGWAKNRIKIIADIIEDRLRKPYDLPPVDMGWLATTLREIEHKMETAI